MGRRKLAIWITGILLVCGATFWFWHDIRVVASHGWLEVVDRYPPSGDEQRVAALLRYGKALVDANRSAEAEPVLLRGLTLRERLDETRSPPLRDFYMALNQTYAQMGQYEKSSFYFRKAMSHLFEIHEQAMQSTGGLGGQLVRIMYELKRANPKDLPALELSFNEAQTSLVNRASRAIARMSERAAILDPALAALEKESQDNFEELRRLVLRSERQEPALVQRVAELSARQSEISARLRRNFPNEVILRDTSLAGIPQLQEALTPDEVLIFFFDMPPKARGAGWTYYWAFTKTESRWDRIGADALDKLAVALRCGLDEAAWRGSGEERCQTALGTDFTLDRYDRGAGLPFSLEKAHRLYSALFGGVEDLIGGKSLIIVPPKVLSQVPAQVLVTKPSDAPLGDVEALKTASWLGTRQTITVVPSVGAFLTLRSRTAVSRAPSSYLGIGNPQLEGVPTCPRITVPTDCPGRGPEKVAAAATQERGHGHRGAPEQSPVSAFSSKNETDVVALRQICPLPDTSYELRCVATSLKASDESLLIGEKATESTVKQMSAAGVLASYRVIHFATHGLLASETELFAKDVEPALLLTPPQQPSESDDGLLTTSEIARLRFDADFVILSACNTAAADGDTREALSGLARAFFYAGARSMLVSHWQVFSDAAVKLVTRAFTELTSVDNGHRVGRAEAMRRSISSVIAEGGLAAHPAYWGAFSLVGDGSSSIN